jgi:4-aminobutyrate aminotransferase
MTMTSKVTPYKKGFGPFAPEVYRAPAPYPYRGVSAKAAADGLEYLFKAEVDPDSVACVVLEPVQGEGGFIPMPREFLERVREICDARGILYVDDEIQSGMGRTGPIWAVEHFDVEPDLIIGGKSLGGGLPLTSVTGRAELMDAVHSSGLGGTFIGNPLSCVAAQAVLEEVTTPEFRQQAEAMGDRLSEGLAGIAARVSAVGEERGLGAMRALELVLDADTKEPAPAVAAATVEIARANGLLLMTSGVYSNVIRVLVPLVASDEVVARGLEILEESIEQAAAQAA